jgi:hypothetical protein
MGSGWRLYTCNWAHHSLVSLLSSVWIYLFPCQNTVPIGSLHHLPDCHHIHFTDLQLVQWYSLLLRKYSIKCFSLPRGAKEIDYKPNSGVFEFFNAKHQATKAYGGRESKLPCILDRSTHVKVEWSASGIDHSALGEIWLFVYSVTYWCSFFSDLICQLPIR